MQLLPGRCIRLIEFAGFTAAARQIASKLGSHGLRPEATIQGVSMPAAESTASPHQSLKCPTIPFNSMPSDASSMLDAALPCIARAD